MPSLNNVKIDALRKDRKGFKIGEDWYSVFSAAQLSGIEYTDTVSFTFTEKIVGESVYRNVKGDVKLAAGSSPSPVGDSPKASTGGGGGGSFGRSFPVAPLAPERSIIRQNSLAHATAFLKEMYSSAESPQEIADKVIAMARMFEAYSAGDLDIEEAERAVKSMKAE